MSARPLEIHLVRLHRLGNESCGCRCRRSLPPDPLTRRYAEVSTPRYVSDIRLAFPTDMQS